MAQSTESLRKQIDDVDDKIIELLRQRIELSNLIIQAKSPAQILDPGREQAILERYTNQLANVSSAGKLKRLVSGILGTSRFYPET